QHAELERRQLHARAADVDAAVALVQERLVGHAELGRRDAVEPSVNGVGSEVERGEMERRAADFDGFVERTETERAERVGEWPRVAYAEVKPAEVRAKAEVVALDVEQRRGLHAARSVARARGEPAPMDECALARRQRVTRRVLRPRGDDGIGPLERR